jgi:hypothetical protein
LSTPQKEDGSKWADGIYFEKANKFSSSKKEGEEALAHLLCHSLHEQMHLEKQKIIELEGTAS